MKIKLLENTGLFIEPYGPGYYTMTKPMFLEYFFPKNIAFEFVPSNVKTDICVSSIQLVDKALLNNQNVNILISVENCSHWKHYIHYNKYGNYGNDMIDIYMYNHISKIHKGVYPTTNKPYIAIPVVYMEIDYYNNAKNNFISMPSLNCPFSEKKFCLLINRSNLNNNIEKLLRKLDKIGQIDHISKYTNRIGNSSCYHSINLLEVFNMYKFVICFENSYNDGYITQKIFNCFLAKTIPLYSGSPIVHQFLNTDGFINIPHDKTNEFDIEIINKLNNNEMEYMKMLNVDKISPTYNNEDYMKEIIDVLNKK